MWFFLVAPSSPPQQVNIFVAARGFNASWNSIDCMERNGPITGYVAELRQLGGATVNRSVVGRAFSADGLVPDTRYTFRVAGVNMNGAGPFSRAISMKTEEDGEFTCIGYSFGTGLFFCGLYM